MSWKAESVLHVFQIWSVSSMAVSLHRDKQSAGWVPLTFPSPFSFPRPVSGGVLDLVSFPQCGSSLHQDVMSQLFLPLWCSLSMWPHQIHPKNALLHKEADLIILEGFKLINGLCHWDMPLLSWCAIPKVTSTVCSSPAFSSLLLERNIFSKILEKLYLQTSVSESPLKLKFQEEKKKKSNSVLNCIFFFVPVRKARMYIHIL